MQVACVPFWRVNDMKVLVLGGSYFVGAAIAVGFAEAGHSVMVANRGTRPPPHPAVQQVIFERNDAGGQRLPDVDLVVDASCYTARDAEHALAALGRLPSQYIMISSAAVYAPPIGGRPHIEGDATPGDPIWGDYGADKARAEDVLKGALGFSLTILRPPYIYGPRNNLEREAFIWDRLLVGRPILIPKNGSSRLQFLHIADLAELVRAIALNKKSGDEYNVGEKKDYSIAEYVRMLGAIARKPVTLIDIAKDIPARSYFPFRDTNLVLDCSKINRAFEVSFRDLKVGLFNTFEWYQNEPRPVLTLTDLEKKFDENPL